MYLYVRGHPWKSNQDQSELEKSTVIWDMKSFCYITLYYIITKYFPWYYFNSCYCHKARIGGGSLLTKSFIIYQIQQ